MATNYEVARKFVERKIASTPTRSCPGRHSMTAGGSYLLSYNTEIAYWLDEDRIAVNPKKYSVSTQGHYRALRTALHESGFRETGEIVEQEARVPGRWGGYGLAWAPKSHEVLPFTVWSRA